jgi:hypothetical protein
MSPIGAKIGAPANSPQTPLSVVVLHLSQMSSGVFSLDPTNEAEQVVIPYSTQESHYNHVHIHYCAMREQISLALMLRGSKSHNIM